MPKMPSYASFDLYLAAQSARNRPLIRALRTLVKRVAPGLEEAVKWGNGCWVKGKEPIAYVYSAPDHVHFGFVCGALLSDPRGLLEGEGAYIRHVKVRKSSDIDARAFGALLRQALRWDRTSATAARRPVRARSRAAPKRRVRAARHA
ncbi:MAG TPA: DUF1801 domain-containing protein [Planctomycetota bacterium]